MTMESDDKVAEVMTTIQHEIDAGRSVKARMLLGHCTQLGLQERKAIAKGLAPLKAEHITHTELDGINKPGCSVSFTTLILVGIGLYAFSR